MDALAAEIGSVTGQHVPASAGAAPRRPGRELASRGSLCTTALADPSVSDLCAAIRTVAERQYADLDRLVRDHFGDRSDPEPVAMRELLKRARAKDVVILDARPAHEYAAGHIAGAMSVPIDGLQTPTPRTAQVQSRTSPTVADRIASMPIAPSRCCARRGGVRNVWLTGFPEWKAAGIAHEKSLRMSKWRCS